MPGEHDTNDVLLLGERVQGLLEQRVGETVVKRTCGWGAGDNDDPIGGARHTSLRAYAAPSQYRRIGFEVAQVKLLLEPRIEDGLAGVSALATYRLQWEHPRQEDCLGEPEGHMVGGLILEVHGGDGGNSQTARR